MEVCKIFFCLVLTADALAYEREQQCTQQAKEEKSKPGAASSDH